MVVEDDFFLHLLAGMINKLCLLFIKFVHRDECENSKGIGITFGFVSRDDDHIWGQLFFWLD